MQNHLQLEPHLRRAWDGRIGALVAHREDSGCWTLDALGAPHVGERSEKELIASFAEKIAALSPQLVTFNGSSIFRSYAIEPWSTELQRQGLLRVRISTSTPTMQLTFATCWHLSVHRRRQPYTNCVGSWGCPASPTGWPVQKSKSTITMGISGRSLSTAKVTCSIHTGYGFATSYSADDCRMPSFSAARLTS
jgi:hypothetical protein